jgi:predicted nuclease with TOPRIM domain
MKKKRQIENEIEFLEIKLLENETKHSQLDQINCLSDEGYNLRKRISKIEGKIEALKWVIK